MSRFHYTADMQDTVTKALGDGWEKNQYYEHHWHFRSDVAYFDGLSIFGSTYSGLLTIKLLIDEEDFYGDLSLAGLEQIATEAAELAGAFRVAVVNLRAAGLQEVTE